MDLLNEPRDASTPDRWNHILPRVLSVVRETDRRRLITVGGAQMGTLAALVALEPPADEAPAVSLHYYEPLAFNHQTAPWAPGSRAWV
ncbi:cellulase family glycosylhydrolase [Microbacterium pygmaeum]|uniref:cellulase family glycosylhydrolase n=1 Tax=Microbacterium pygmaeum TaxID=370764 RepID=UPI0012F78A3F